MKVFIILGALNALMAVGTGAFGAHALDGKLSEHYMSVWEKSDNISNVSWVRSCAYWYYWWCT